MRIYRFWNCRCEKINGLTVRFKAGSNDSPEAAALLTEEKIALYRQFANGETPEAQKAALRMKLYPAGKDIYEVPIFEELIRTVDDRNIITRNRYGALVLNSEDHAFLDIDFDAYLPALGLKDRFLQFLGKVPRLSKAERLEQFIRQCINEKFPYTSFRLYRTANGFRLLTPAKGDANSAVMAEIMQDFHCDALYMTLCAKQNCFRARLTPKPRRIKMKTALKFLWPPVPEQQSAKELWLKEYAACSEKYKSCSLVAEFGPPINSPVVGIHDEICKCGENLPLA
ncbi:MAG: hypothetical protein E7048_05755 [Lentisphaerae bacterium]|nr:hypothetical protein [Lentisphaerota bacterium]